MYYRHLFRLFFFFNDTATTEIYTLSLHDALPISRPRAFLALARGRGLLRARRALGRRECRGTDGERGDRRAPQEGSSRRSEEHTSELQSRQYLVCRLLLEKKKKTHTQSSAYTELQ